MQRSPHRTGSAREAAGKARPCPSCRAPMEHAVYERLPVGRVELDLCWSCHAIWFDRFESAQLTPGAVLKLFEQIHAHESEPPRPLADILYCAACRGQLKLTQDVQRTNRIVYYRCVEGHGRLSTFYQFLREKNFVRSLSRGEVAQLSATVKQVRCSSCGASVDLVGDAQCKYCRAPIAILDADAVRRTLEELSDRERRRNLNPGEAIAKLFEAMPPEAPRGGRSRHIDLVSDALGLMLDA